MVDKFCFIVVTLIMCFSLMWIGWYIGVEDTKKKYTGRGRKNEMENL